MPADKSSIYIEKKSFSWLDLIWRIFAGIFATIVGGLVLHVLISQEMLLTKGVENAILCLEEKITFVDNRDNCIYLLVEQFDSQAAEDSESENQPDDSENGLIPPISQELLGSNDNLLENKIYIESQESTCSKFPNNKFAVTDNIELQERMIEGGVIYINPGEYELINFGEITRSIELIGAGKTCTTISSSDHSVLTFNNSEGVFKTRNINFQSKSNGYSNVLEIVNATDTFIDNCRFSGAKQILNADGSSFGGKGIVVNSKQGTITKSIIESNGKYGIDIYGNTQITISSNQISGNFDVGILYDSSRAGLICSNIIENHNLSGVDAPSEFDKLKLLNNTFRHNNYGVSTSPLNPKVVELINNEFHSNTGYGIFGANRSILNMSSNTFFNNSHGEVYIGQNAEITELENQTSELLNCMFPMVWN